MKCKNLLKRKSCCKWLNPNFCISVCTLFFVHCIHAMHNAYSISSFFRPIQSRRVKSARRWCRRENIFNEKEDLRFNITITYSRRLYADYGFLYSNSSVVRPSKIWIIGPCLCFSHVSTFWRDIKWTTRENLQIHQNVIAGWKMTCNWMASYGGTLGY